MSVPPKAKHNGLIWAAGLFAAVVAVSIAVQSALAPSEAEQDEAAKSAVSAAEESAVAATAPEQPKADEKTPVNSFSARIREYREKEAAAPKPEAAASELPTTVSTEPAEEEFPLELPQLVFTADDIGKKAPEPMVQKTVQNTVVVAPQTPQPTPIAQALQVPAKAESGVDKDKDGESKKGGALPVVRVPLGKSADKSVEYVFFVYYYRPSWTNWDVVLIPVQPQKAK